FLLELIREDRSQLARSFQCPVADAKFLYIKRRDFYRNTHSFERITSGHEQRNPDPNCWYQAIRGHYSLQVAPIWIFQIAHSSLYCLILRYNVRSEIPNSSAASFLLPLYFFNAFRIISFSISSRDRFSSTGSVSSKNLGALSW